MWTTAAKKKETCEQLQRNEDSTLEQMKFNDGKTQAQYTLQIPWFYTSKLRGLVNKFWLPLVRIELNVAKLIRKHGLRANLR